MLVSFGNIEYECSTALKGDNYVHLFDQNGAMVASFEGVSDFSGFTFLSGGNWTYPDSIDDCYVAVIGEYGSIRKSPRKFSSIDAPPATIGDTEPTETFPGATKVGELYFDKTTKYLYVCTALEDMGGGIFYATWEKVLM